MRTFNIQNISTRPFYQVVKILCSLTVAKIVAVTTAADLFTTWR